VNKIGKVELFTIALGFVIGWGAFMLPGSFFLQSAGVLNTFIGFTIAIIMVIFIEKNYSVLMSKYKERVVSIFMKKNIWTSSRLCNRLA